MRRSRRWGWGWGWGWLALWALACHPPSAQPNIVFVLVDDLGWVDSSVYGSQYYRTPALERLAAAGMRFTDAYASNPVCTPTRASTLAGKYPERLRDPDDEAESYERRLRRWRRMVTPLSPDRLAPGEYTVAEALRDAGYRTSFIGKWHLMGSVPEEQGFELNVGGSSAGAATSFHSPYGLPGLRDGPRGEYLTDRLTAEALDFIAASRDAPFFLYLSHYAVHAPWGHKKQMTWRWARRKDPTGRHDNPIMASMIESVDEGLGRILDKLEELGIADRTIVVFTSDNGGNTDEIRPGQPATNNAPLRGAKGTLYEGGTRVPLVVSWPGVTAPGSVSAVPVSTLDLYPTFVELAGASAGEQQLDGTSLVGVLAGADAAEPTIFCHRPNYGRREETVPGTYVRSGPWKLIRFYGAGTDRADVHELYNLADDIGEQHDLAAELPERVASLSALIDAHLEATRALVPLRNPLYDPLAEAVYWRSAAHEKP